MTGDTTPISDEAMMADIRLCLASYGFIAANQAEFLLAEVARLSAAPLLVSADSTQAERINTERREREALIGRLRAELADERTLSARYAAEVGRLCAELVDAEAQRVEMTTQRDLWRHDALAGDGRIDALSEKLRDRDAELAALRTAGGQERAFCYDCSIGDHEACDEGDGRGSCECDDNLHPFPPAPVGGQAEPSDTRCRGTYMTQIHGSFRCERHAGHRGSHGAAVSGKRQDATEDAQ